MKLTRKIHEQVRSCKRDTSNVGTRLRSMDFIQFCQRPPMTVKESEFLGHLFSNYHCKSRFYIRSEKELTGERAGKGR
jgi:hypothetical protein